MIDYNTIPNTAGAFPNVVSQNATGPGATDGTPYIKQVIDDLWGARQALMDAAGLTPNAVQESATASQKLEALRNVLGHPGEVIAWHGNTNDPSSVNIRMLQLTGQGVLVASYPELDAACWVGAGANPTAPAYYRADDAAGTIRNPAGIYLILPDMRGYAARGLDLAGSVDPDGAGRALGDAQAYAMQSHTHDVQESLGTGQLYYTSTLLTAGAVSIEHITTTPLASKLSAFAPPIGGNINLYESRMANVSVHWCIRY